ncbi:galectin-3 [Trichomycterus rosablanca]|uniref:galectin-3 n=1 Tax=Trichomycterus rosablanca TaxID=2290929 RepID=UPI002F359681
MSCPASGSQGNSTWPCPNTQQPGSPVWPSQPYQPCWHCQPNQYNWPGMQPTVPNWPASQPVPTSQPGWPSFPPTQPSQPIPPGQPIQPIPPGQPNQPSQPSQPSQINWPSQLPKPTPPSWHGNPGQPGWPNQGPTDGQQAWPPASSTGPLSVPFNMNLPRGIYDKLMLTIRGQVKPDAKMFTVNFLRGNDIPLHINPRFNEMGKQVIVRNHKLGEQWGPEERNLLAPFPFAAGQHFEMKIFCTVSEFKVVVNNTAMFDFKYRIKEVNQIDRINILHDVNLTSVSVDTLP